MTNGGSQRQLDELLPDYDIQREVGRGAMGIVYLAHHQRLDRLVAIKELQGTLAADPATRERFVVEARALAALNHPHVVPVFDYVERGEHCVLIMEQLPGGTVWDRFVENGLTFAEATAITLATCSALAHAHAQQILHRDIKPENLMFAADGALKVTDFGIARMVNGASTKATIDGSVLGTPAYMAPEQAEGAKVGPPADVYATATMFYEMTSGRLPFDQADSVVAMLAARITKDPIDLVEVAPGVPREVAQVAMRGLARDADRRTASAEQFGTELAAAAASAWGPEWLGGTGYAVRGSERIDRAARTTIEGQTPSQPATATGRATIVAGATDESRPAAADATVVPDGDEDRATTSADATPTDAVSPNETSAPETIVSGTAKETAVPPTSPPGSTPDTSSDLTPDSSPDSSADSSPDSSWGDLPAAAAVPVMPKPSDRDVGRAVDVSGRELIDIAELTAVPRRPIAMWLVALGLLVAGLAWAFLGGGRTVDETPTSLLIDGQAVDAGEAIEVDLSEPLRIRGGPAGAPLTISFEQVGIPIGAAETVDFGPDGSAEVDPGFVANVSTGAMVASIEIGEGAGAEVIEAEVTATNPWFLTAVAIGLILLALFALAAIESNLKAYRRGRGGIGSGAGLIVTGGLLGISAAGLSVVIAGRPHGPISIIGPAVLCAVGALVVGLAVAAGRRRRRIGRQNTRTVAIAKLQSR